MSMVISILNLEVFLNGFWYKDYSEEDDGSKHQYNTSWSRRLMSANNKILWLLILLVVSNTHWGRNPEKYRWASHYFSKIPSPDFLLFSLKPVFHLYSLGQEKPKKTLLSFSLFLQTALSWCFVVFGETYSIFTVWVWNRTFINCYTFYLSRGLIEQ